MSDDVVPLAEIETREEECPIDESAYLRGPPGAGKTTTSAARVAKLIEEHDYELADVCWVTYRKQLAKDTLQRFAEWDLIDDDELGHMSTGATRLIGTIHGVCRRIIVDNTSRPDLRDLYGVDIECPNPRLGTATWQQRSSYCSHRDIWYGSAPHKKDSIGELLFDTIQWHRENLLDVHDGCSTKCGAYRELSEERDWYGSVGRISDEWEDFKSQIGAIDYTDMVSEVVERGLTPDAEVLVVDEFHDASPLLAKLVLQWAESMDIVVIAGDQDQIVNAHQGPSRELFDHVKSELDIPEVLLDHSYRVPALHWDVATEMLAEAHTPPEITVQSGGCMTEYNSPDFVPENGKGWKSLPGPTEEGSPAFMYENTAGSLMYLARTQMQVRGITATLDEEGLMYVSQSGISDWSGDRIHLHNAAQKVSELTPDAVDGGGLGRDSKLTAYRDSGTVGLSDVELEADEVVALIDYTPAKYLDVSRTEAAKVSDDLSDATRSVTLAEIDELIGERFVTEFATTPVNAAKSLLKGDLEKDEHEALVQGVRRYDRPVRESEIRSTVCTVHAAKGGEADHVVLYDGVTTRIEAGMYESTEQYNNEMRTWYVALTRAMDTVHVMRDAFPQRFMTSILPENIVRKRGNGGSNESQQNTQTADD